MLPATVQDLQATTGAAVGIAAPVSGQTYEYVRLRGPAYRLCAIFSRPSQADVPNQWRHLAGHACFTLDVGNNVELGAPPR